MDYDNPIPRSFVWTNPINNMVPILWKLHHETMLSIPGLGLFDQDQTELQQFRDDGVLHIRHHRTKRRFVGVFAAATRKFSILVWILLRVLIVVCSFDNCKVSPWIPASRANREELSNQPMPAPKTSWFYAKRIAHPESKNKPVFHVDIHMQ